MDAALAALIGAAVGAAGSFGVMWIQQRQQTKRERLKIAADLALADYNVQVDLAKRRGQPSRLPPISAFVMYHAEYLDELAKGEITPEIVQRLNKRQEQLIEHYYDFTKGREA
jgi:hypothetical protein